MSTTGRLSLRQQIESDLRLAQATARVAPDLVRNRPGTDTTVADRWEEKVRAHRETIAIVDAAANGAEYTYGDIDDQANRVANWAAEQGIEAGDVVALLLLNRPEFVSTWLGLAKVGAVTALINTNLTGDPLRHSIQIANAAHLIVDHELLEHWRAISDGPELTEWVFGDGGTYDTAIAAASTSRPPAALRSGLTNRDPLFYIYTSGTTGLPKAARFSHAKFLIIAAGMKGLVGINADDRMYVTLPLYHTAGGVMALGGTFMAGGTVVLARKFSASHFWDDCADYDATAFQYIGELCRYLVNSPSHPRERKHRLRICVGNGLRPDVWPTFQERFAIPQIVEFYGATEGTASLFNLDNRVGAIGRLRPKLAKRMGIHLVAYDHDTDEIVRDSNGRVVPVDADTPGEAITRISDTTPFDGYSDEKATEQKILRDAFSTGDTYFRTGDLLRQDTDGYYYFVDRIGDTFRWKGENVSTAEVAAVLGTCPGVQEANVYGVEVPGTDGRAGMATLVVDDNFDVTATHVHIGENLASYARPLFLRIQTEVEITATFKHRKVDAVAEGFDPALKDPIYLLDSDKGAYVKLTKKLHGEITGGSRRL